MKECQLHLPSSNLCSQINKISKRNLSALNVNVSFFDHFIRILHFFLRFFSFIDTVEQIAITTFLTLQPPPEKKSFRSWYCDSLRISTHRYVSCQDYCWMKRSEELSSQIARTQKYKLFGFLLL